MVKITRLEVCASYRLRLIFDDGVEKVIDGAQFIGDDPFTRPLADPAYFRQVRVYDNGRGLYWPNTYDICPDHLRYYVPAVATRRHQPTVPPAAQTA